MDDAISRKGTSAWLENMGYSYPAKVIMDEKRFPSVLGTNLAEVGTDVPDTNVGNKAQLSDKGTTFGNGGEIKRWSKDIISRQAAIMKILGQPPELHYPSWYAEQIKELPPAEPKIIYCKDCRKHNKRIGDYVEKSDGTYDWIWKDQACPLAEFRGVAQGHEFDYQFCVYGERRTE